VSACVCTRVCVYVSACVCARVCMCECECVCVCVCACTCVCVYENARVHESVCIFLNVCLCVVVCADSMEEQRHRWRRRSGTTRYASACFYRVLNVFPS